MKAFRIATPRHFEAVEIENRTTEQLGADEVLLRPIVGGICGSDLPSFEGRRVAPIKLNRYVNGRLPAGLPLHEVVGEVLACPNGRFELGAQVVGWVANSDALAELVVTRSDNVVEFDPSLTPQQAVVMQPLACVMHTIARLGSLADKRVAVIGLGPIGLLFCHAASNAGASHVEGVDVVDRGRLAGTFRIDRVVHLASDRWVASLDESERFDVVIEAVGNQVGTLADAISALAQDGIVFYFGLPEDPVYPVALEELFMKAGTLMAGGVSHSNRTRALELAKDYVEQHPEFLAASVSHEFEFGDRLDDAYEMACNPSPERVKVIINF